MKKLVREQRLAFVATVGPKARPNLSPKGSITVWDDRHLVFADVRSPGTVGNLRRNRAIEINIVDPIVRKGYRFTGTASVLTKGPLYEKILTRYEHDEQLFQDGTAKRGRAVVLVKVRRALPLVSPIYDLGLSEKEVEARWQRYWSRVKRSF
jgi:predicted pyridoxine 5'-phosphate oxidase superfamily flavin-nucleotide-binding protein